MTTTTVVGPRLETREATLGYDKRVISAGLTMAIPDGSFTVIIGPNASGKSTLLKALSRLLPPSSGQVLLDGKQISSIRPREVARSLGLLPQTSLAPDGITVADLVARGRHPHQRLLQQWSTEDQVAVDEALEMTQLTPLATRLVDELSGGQRQRVWIAMALAQQTTFMLLDEPTTFLDIAHQIDLLELFTALHRDGRTLVAVLHDLNQAARYATHLIAMRDGAVVAEGHPEEIVTAETVRAVFGIDSVVIADPVTGRPLVVPRGAARRELGKLSLT